MDVRNRKIKTSTARKTLTRAVTASYRTTTALLILLKIKRPHHFCEKTPKNK